MIFSVANAAVSFIAPPSGGETVTFPENKPPGTTIYALQANDPAGNSPSFSTHSARCGSTDVTPFPISNTDALLVPAWGLDAENCSMFTFQFRVVAGGSTATSDSLTVIVTNINDNPPQFNETTRTYYGEVWKNRKDESCVNKKLITAFDPDNLHNITLAIAGAQETFAVNNSGCVYVKSSSGLESLASPTILTILASDGGHTSTATLNITVHEDPCKNSPCQNGGTCNSDGTNYSCICLSGYSDRLCDKVDYCFIKPCQHNGSCNNTENGYICNCLYPYANKDTSNKNCTVLRTTTSTTTSSTITPSTTPATSTTTPTSPNTSSNTTPNGNETKDKDNNSKNKPNDWLITGICLSSSGPCSVVVFVVVYYNKKKKEEINIKSNDTDANERQTSQPTEMSELKTVVQKTDDCC